jgi:hypothetical protein
MKKTLVIIISFLVCLSTINKTNAQTVTDPVYDSLAQLDLFHYVNKPVDSLLQAIPVSYNYFKIIGHVSNYKAYYLAISYPGGSKLHIRVTKYQYMNPVDINRIWDINLYRKENLGYVSLTHPDFNSKQASH